MKRCYLATNKLLSTGVQRRRFASSERPAIVACGLGATIVPNLRLRWTAAASPTVALCRLVRGGPSALFQAEGDNTMSETTLYERLGDYDANVAVVNDLLPRLQSDSQLAGFWQHRGEDGIKRETQLLIDFLCSSAGGPLYYTGRDMKTSHRGMRISESDWSAFLRHLNATLETFRVPQLERDEAVAFVLSTKPNIVEV